MNRLFKMHFQAARTFRVLLLMVLLCSFRGQEPSDEYTIKGMFIYNFTRYIDWSPGKAGNTFVIAVLGRSEIIKSLQQITANKKVNNGLILVRAVTSLSEAADCQIVFIPR